MNCVEGHMRLRRVLLAEIVLNDAALHLKHQCQQVAELNEGLVLLAHDYFSAELKQVEQLYKFLSADGPAIIQN